MVGLKTKHLAGRKFGAKRTKWSDVDAADVVTPSARLGADLRVARERLGWALADVAAGLRIRRAYLEALEEGRVEDIPGTAYALGYLRSYAASLGLDPDEMSRRFRAATDEDHRKTELVFPAPVASRAVPAGAVVLLGAALAVGAYIGWYRMTGDALPRQVSVQPVPERLAGLAPSPPSIQLAPAPAASGGSVSAEPVYIMPSVPPSQAAAAIPVLAPHAPAAPILAPATAAPAAPVAESTPAVDADTRIQVRAKADSWIQVRDKQGQVVFNRVLRAGEFWAIPGKQSLLLTTGNAGGTELLVDGVLTASLGGAGAVRRDLPLDADAIKAGKLAQNAVATAPVGVGVTPLSSTTKPASQ